jgi:hypothetical protein
MDRDTRQEARALICREGCHAHDGAAGRVADALSARDQEIAERKSEKDRAYEERNRVVAALARAAISLGYRAIRTQTAIEGWSDDWHGCVRIDLPTGQVSWHYHDSQEHLFSWMPQGEMEWDGHDTREKYRRVDEFVQREGREIAELRARCAELEADRERLDWFDTFVREVYAKGTSDFVVCVAGRDGKWRGDGIRAAIDAARRQEPDDADR